MFFTPTLTLGFGFLRRSRSLFGFGFLRRSTAYVPIGVLTRLYRFHPWNRTTYIRVGVPLQFFLLQDLAL